MTLIASDGYEYQDLTQRLLGRPLDTRRNQELAALRKTYPEKDARTWFEAYDRETGTFYKKSLAAWSAVNIATYIASANRAGESAAGPAPTAAVHPAHQPALPGRLGP